jgi:hypothetical protein
MKLEGKSELFRALRPSRMASPSIDHPGPKVYGQLSPDDKDGHDFNCDICGRRFVVDFDAYEGEFDHPPSVPVCDDCQEDCAKTADY